MHDHLVCKFVFLEVHKHFPVEKLEVLFCSQSLTCGFFIGTFLKPKLWDFCVGKILMILFDSIPGIMHWGLLPLFNNLKIGCIYV